MESRFALLLLACLFPTVAAAGHGAQPASAVEDGQVYLYIQPLPVQSQSVTFSIETMAALTDRGGELPLQPVLPAIGGEASRRQRLLAVRTLPPGAYHGLSIKVARASRGPREDEVALTVPDEAYRIDVPFVVSRGRAAVLWLEARPGEAAGATGAFDPGFAAYVAPRPMMSLSGFASAPSADTITVFDKRRRQAAAVIPVAGQPSGMALDQRAGRLYVACPQSDEVLVVDVAAAEVVERARLFPGDGPRELAITSDGRLLLSANPGSNSVTVFETQPLTRLERIEVGSGPAAIAMDPASRRAFVFNTLSGSISVIDVAGRRVAATLSVDASPLRGQFSARGDRLFVIHRRATHASVVDPLQLSVISRPRLRSPASAIRLDGRRNLLYLAGPDEATIDVYDPNTLLPVDFLKTTAGVAHLTIDAEDNTLYFASPATRTLGALGLVDRKAIAEIDLVQAPYWVAVMGEK